MSDQKQWYMVVHSEDGRSVSMGTDLADPLPATLKAIPISDESAAAILCSQATWDAATRAVVPVVPPPLPEVSVDQLVSWMRGRMRAEEVDAAIREAAGVQA